MAGADQVKAKINHPRHYQGQQFEVIDIIEDYQLGFHLGNVLKYTLRAGKKSDRVEDLRKAVWYLEREIANDMMEEPK